MKLFGFFVGFSAAQLPIIGLDNDETISISSLARGRGGRGGGSTLVSDGGRLLWIVGVFAAATVGVLIGIWIGSEIEAGI